jgi:hypothetical protein
MEIKRMIKNEFDSPITDMAILNDHQLLILGYSNGTIKLIGDVDRKNSPKRN